MKEGIPSPIASMMADFTKLSEHVLRADGVPNPVVNTATLEMLRMSEQKRRAPAASGSMAL